MELIVFAFRGLSTIIFWATLAAAGLLFLRVFITWIGANPFGRITYNLTRITEPLVRPLRNQVGGRSLRYDLMPLVLGVMILFIGLFVSSMIWQLTDIFAGVANTALRGTLTFRYLLVNVINLLGLLYVTAIFLRFFLPFFGIGYRSKFMMFIFRITEPLLKPLRRIFIFGMFDFSPLIAMLLVQVATGVLVGIMS